MNEAVFTIVLVWGFIAMCWIPSLHLALKQYKSDFVNYKVWHQKMLSLYIEAARQNRELIKQNQKYKHAIADSIFHPNAFKLPQVLQWYAKYDIKPGNIDEEVSSEAEVKHFKEADEDITKWHENNLK